MGKPGMRRCQRLPELRIPVTRRDRKTKATSFVPSAVLAVLLEKDRVGGRYLMSLPEDECYRK